MEKYDYPEEKYERRMREHNSFVKAVEKFKYRYDRGRQRSPSTRSSS